MKMLAHVRCTAPKGVAGRECHGPRFRLLSVNGVTVADMVSLTVGERFHESDQLSGNPEHGQCADILQ